MVKINLRSIVTKDGIDPILKSLAEQSGSQVSIEDNMGKILFGSPCENDSEIYPLIINGEKIGLVKGNKNALVIAELLNYLCQKESEKKKLGSEVLNLYKEINIIFNFSEKLARAIKATSICDITLQEARHVINSSYGVVLLLNEEKTGFNVITTNHEGFFPQEIINNKIAEFHENILTGQSQIITDTVPLAEAGIILNNITSLIYAALKVNDRVMGAIILACSEETPYTAADLKLLTTLALQSSAAIESALLYEKNIKESREREEAMRLVYEATGKFVPFEFLRSLGHNVITDVKLGDQVEKIVTVLFSDIRDYTTLSEKMTPEANFKFVCAFNERMGPAIRKHNGFINQYLGDAIMAIFPGNAAEALSAAIDMQKEVAKLNEIREANNEMPIKIGVGMHTGPLIMGITGDADRMDATTISDTVNTASRLESLTKHYKASIILSDACALQIIEKEKFHLRYLGLVQLKGKNESLQIHECFSDHTGEEINKKKSTLSAFNEGINQYLNSAFNSAVNTFQSISELDPEDHTAAFFLETAKKNLDTGEMENSKGVIEMAAK